MQVRYDKVYVWRGHRVEVVPGTKISRIPDYSRGGDARMVAVRPVPPVQTTLDRWEVPIDQLEEVTETDEAFDDRPWGEQQEQVDWLERDIGP